MKNFNKFLLPKFTFLLFLLVGSSNLSLPSDSNTARQTLLKKIPPRTSLGDASKLMLSYGLECNLEKSKPFQSYQNIDFLYCQKKSVAFPLVCDSVWEIAIVYRKEIVSDILVYYYTSCI